MIGDRYGDRILTTYHRSESAMDKRIGDAGDRLKEDLCFCIWKRTGYIQISIFIPVPAKSANYASV